jgi:hypothetical protein
MYSGCLQNMWGWTFFSLQGDRQKIISVNLVFFSLTEWFIFHFCGNVSSGNIGYDRNISGNLLSFPPPLFVLFHFSFRVSITVVTAIYEWETHSEKDVKKIESWKSGDWRRVVKRLLSLALPARSRTCCAVRSMLPGAE